MEKILLRPALLSDAKSVYDVTKRAFAEYAKSVGKFENIHALKESIGDVRRDIEHKHVYVCDIDGDIAGAVRFCELEDGIYYLSRFATDAHMQNLGIGSLLLEKVKIECLNMGARAIVLYTASKMRSSVAFYLKNGYYIHSIDKRAEYIRALMVQELAQMDELFDYEKVLTGCCGNQF